MNKLFLLFLQACCIIYAPKAMLQAIKYAVAETTVFFFRKPEMISCFHLLVYSNGFTS